MFDRRLAQCFDWGLLGLVCAVSAIGLTALYSAVNAGTLTPQKILFSKQLIWFGIGLAVMIFTFLFSYKSFERLAHVFYAGGIAMLIGVSFYGKIVGGSKRWLVLGPVSIQPSEIIKIAVVIILARYYSKIINPQGLSFRDLLVPFIITIIPFVLIVKQPDLGTAMVVVLISASITIFVKIERRTFSYIMLVCTLGIPLVWFILKGYQKQRILTFLNPERDPLGAGYHIIQSKIAIGSGMLSGKGFLKGTQNTLSFLPEQHTDFIFSVLSEEWGLMGSLTTLLIFIMLIAWGFNIAHRCRDPFGTILAIGITFMLAWQVLINIGMVMGLMPVVGVPLPFISYGGSSVISTMICVGILLNVSMRRFE